MKIQQVFLLSVVLLIGTLIGITLSVIPVAAQIRDMWSKDEVVAIVLVKPGIGDFLPV